MAFQSLERKLTAAQLDAARRSGDAFAVAVHSARREAGPDAVAVAWVSDIHLHARRAYEHDLGIYGRFVDASANFHLALTEMAQVQPDLVVFGGDVADSGCGGEAPCDEYGDFKRLTDELLPATRSSLLVLGNHDHADRPLTESYRSELGKIARADWPAPVDAADHYYSALRHGWRFLALDSRQGQPPSETQRQWLAAQLETDAATPTVLLVHRPFVSVGNWVDNHRLVDRRTFDLIDRADCVKAVLSGHTHKAAAWRYRRQIHTVFPATAYGIGHTCGWGCVILGRDRVSGVFVKDLAGECFDHVPYAPVQQAGDFRLLTPALFENSPLCDPCLLPRRNAPAARD